MTPTMMKFALFQHTIVDQELEKKYYAREDTRTRNMVQDRNNCPRIRYTIY